MLSDAKILELFLAGWSVNSLHRKGYEVGKDENGVPIIEKISSERGAKLWARYLKMEKIAIGGKVKESLIKESLTETKESLKESPEKVKESLIKESLTETKESLKESPGLRTRDFYADTDLVRAQFEVGLQMIEALDYQIQNLPRVSRKKYVHFKFVENIQCDLDKIKKYFEQSNAIIVRLMEQCYLFV